MKYDICIIGGGFGGLICARQLAKAGRSVLLLERQQQLGGCIQSYQRHGMQYDTGLHYVGGLAEGQPLNQLFTELGLMELPWQRLDAEGFDHVTIGNQTYQFREGYDNFVEGMSDYFPKEKQALKRYVEMLQKAEQVTFNDQEEALKMMEVNAYEYLNELFKDPLLINVLSGTALKTELRRQSLPLYSFAHTTGSYIQSSWRLKGEGNLMVNKLADDIRAMGGTIRCKQEVEELIEQGGKITAVRCKNGEQYEANTFISDVHPAITFDWVKDSYVLKGMYRRRMKALENTFGIFTVSLKLKPDVLPYFNHNKYVYKKPNVWTFYEDVGGIGGVMVSCRVPEDDKTDAQQVDLLTPMPWTWCQPWKDTTIGHRGEEYLSMKERMANECIKLAERVIPGLSEMIAEQYTSTPLTYRDYTLTPEGSAYGVRKDCRSVMLTMLSPQTPIPNLLLTGQNLMLHGLEGVAMTAMNTTNIILK